MEEMNKNRRLEELKARMQGYADYTIIFPGSNLYYLTGLDPLGTMERPFFLVVPDASSPFFIVPQLYWNELKESFSIRVWKDEDDPYTLLGEEIKNGRRLTIAVEDSLPVGAFFQLKKKFPDAEFKSINPILYELRLIKGEEEVDLIRRASRIVDQVFEELTKDSLMNMSEIEVAEMIINLIKEKGGDGPSFDPIVASGSNGSNPHHKPSAKKILKGDMVVLDFGAKFRMYCSDITRTVAIGNVSSKGREIYDIVLNAQENAFQKVVEGVGVNEIDLAARRYIEAKNYGEYFTHRTGHGLGLDVHEPPYITKTNVTNLKDGMVFTIEPGIYLPGKLGVRIEDDIHVSNKGRRLTEANRELLVL